MKAMLITLSILLLGGVVVLGLVLFGPLSDLISFAGKEKLKTEIVDFFGIESRPGVGGTDGFTDGGSDPQGQTPILGWTLQGVNGQTIEVRPFAQTSTSTSSPSEPGTSTQAPPLPLEDIDVFGTGTQPDLMYLVTYVAADQSFNIVLLKEPLSASRFAVEEELLKKLNITKRQACFLRYTLGTTRWVSEFYSGKNLGFSFCPGATPL